jgi:DNA ligase-associated metallophosphoesterase
VEVGATGDRFELMHERAVYWPAARTLLVADLHLGKSETLRASGVAMPAGVMEADLRRLAAALERTSARRLIVLGDLLHAGIGLTTGVIEGFAAWRDAPERRAIEIAVTVGNHDRALDDVAGAWRLARVGEEIRESGFVFRHAPAARPGAYVWAGHVHPMVSLRGGGDCVRLACFWLSARVGLLPAFSVFTRGVGVAPEPGDRVYALAPDGVFKV